MIMEEGKVFIYKKNFEGVDYRESRRRDKADGLGGLAIHPGTEWADNNTKPNVIIRYTKRILYNTTRFNLKNSHNTKTMYYLLFTAFLKNNCFFQIPRTEVFCKKIIICDKFYDNSNSSETKTTKISIISKKINTV